MARYFIQRYLLGHQQWKQPAPNIDTEPVTQEQAARMLGLQDETMARKYLPTYVKKDGVEYMLYREEQ